MSQSKWWVMAGLLMVVVATGCARPPRTTEQVAGPIAPHDLRLGRTPPGGPSEAATGAGAGGSGAAGYESGRVSGAGAEPVTPVYAPGFMAPNGSSGSGLSDRGQPIPAVQPIIPANSASVTQPITATPPQLPPNVRG